MKDIEIPNIQFDPNRAVFRAEMTPAHRGTPHVFVERHEISDSSSILTDDYSEASEKMESFPLDNYPPLPLPRTPNENLGIWSTARNPNPRVVRWLLTLKKTNQRGEDSLLAKVKEISPSKAVVTNDVQSIKSTSNVIIDGENETPPTSEETSKIVDVILQIKSDDDSFPKVEVTKALRNTILRAATIDRVLRHMLAMGCLKEIEVQKPVTGRPPSPKYQILWGKTKYFP